MNCDDLMEDFLGSLDTLTVITESRPRRAPTLPTLGTGESTTSAGCCGHACPGTPIGDDVGGGEDDGDDDGHSESLLSALSPDEDAIDCGDLALDDLLPCQEGAGTVELVEEEDDDEGGGGDLWTDEAPSNSDGARLSPTDTADADTADADTADVPVVSMVVSEEDGVAAEQTDVVAPLEDNGDIGAPFYTESLLKPTQRSYHSDGTDRSYSFASEATEFSPVQSPRDVEITEGDGDDGDSETMTPSTYEQRLVASVHEHAASSSTGEGSDVHEVHLHRSFTMDDVACFDPHFGRGVFLDELGQTFIDGSASKSLASYRLSSLCRVSQTKSDVLKQGWLMKRGEFVPSWHKRWFTLRRMPQGPMLTYAKDNSESAPAKVIDLSSTSRCIVPPKPAKEHEFRILTSADSSRREYAVVANSNYELTEWVRAIQSSINQGNKSAFEGASDFQRIWNETGIHGFLVRYGVRKVSMRNHLQTRVLELNFADQTITVTRRGESLTSMHFNDVLRISITAMNTGEEDHGLVINFSGKHRSWPIFLDTKQARDDLVDILEKISTKDVVGSDLEARCSRLRLKSGFMERRNVGPQATLKGRLFVCLYENSVVFYPDEADVSCARPWYVVSLKGLKVSCSESKCVVYLGRLQLTCLSRQECREWHSAIVAAMSLPAKVIEVELKERVKIRNAFHNSVFRLRKLLKANVKPEVNGPPKDHKTIELMMRKLWELTFPSEPYTSNSDSRWQELGFQRGGPASDLRSSGLLGLYCLIYFVTYPSGEFKRILDRTRFGVSEGNMQNYPLAIGCINVVAILMETLGFGDAGSHSEGCSPSAMKTFVRLIANTVADSAAASGERRSSLSEKSLESFETWDEIIHDADNHVFEDVFCTLYPVLDTLFVQMEAGYMEFGQVVAAFKRRLGVIFDQLPPTLAHLEELASEPCMEAPAVPGFASRRSSR